MRFVQIAELAPRICAVSGRGEGPFIDFQTVIDRPLPTALYLHVGIVEEAAKELGMVPGREVDALQDQLKEMGAELERVKEIMQTAGKLDELIGSTEERT